VGGAKPVARNQHREVPATPRLHTEGVLEHPASRPASFKPQGNGQVLGRPGKRGAAFALARLELQEEEGYRRLEAALTSGNAVAIDSAQTYWLRVAETLRRLDRELEFSRRSEEQMISLKTAQDTMTFVSECLRISLSVFLSTDGLTLAAGFKPLATSKFISSSDLGASCF
jgi:hypothetical protein